MNKKTLYVYILLLPFIDLLTSLQTRLLNIPISIGMIFKIGFIIYLLIHLVFNSSSKYKKTSIVFIFLCCIFSLITILLKFNSLNLSGLLMELTFLFKVLYFPIMVPLLLVYFDDYKMDVKALNKVLVTNLFSYAILLFLPYIFGLAFDTYTHSLAGKIGFFYAGNEISIIMLLLFPFIYPKYINKNLSFVIIPLFIIYVISLIGTKSSMMGLLIISFFCLLLSFFSKGIKCKKIIFSLIIFIFSLGTFFNSKTIANLSINYEIQDIQDIQDNEIIVHDISSTINDNSSISKLLTDIYNKYGKALLSDRDILYQNTLNDYLNNYNTKTLLFGIGFTKNNETTHLIELDPFDIFFRCGVIGLCIMLTPFLYFAFNLIKLRKLKLNLIFTCFMIFMLLGVSLISGHIFTAPAVGIYLTLFFIIGFNELKMISQVKNLKNKITIFALHLNHGGIERSICNKANILVQKNDVEVICLYNFAPVAYHLDSKVKVKYLTNNLKPNKQELILALKSKNIKNIITEGFKTIKILYLKNNLLIKEIFNCNSQIVISTRIDFSKKLIKYSPYKNVKIAEEHRYHNNEQKYLKKLKNLLKKVDYLFVSSKAIKNDYDRFYNKYSDKIKVNYFYADSDNSVSKLNNHNIISVGRLEPEKGFIRLIEIMPALNKNINLNIVGDGSQKEALEEKINILNLKDRVKLYGYKNAEELNKLYCDSSLYLMGSYEESFGLVLIEAASHGLPLIAYQDAEGAKEIIKDKGFLCNNSDEVINAINNLFKDKNLMKKCSSNSLEIASNYTYENVKKQIVDFFENLFEKTINLRKRVLFISSSGGHLGELLQLKEIFDTYDYGIITEAKTSTSFLKNEYKNVSYLKFGTRKNLFKYLFVCIENIVLSTIWYIKNRPNVIITTGTHTAVFMCYLGKIFGSKIIFIETFANINSKTLAGKLVYPISDVFIVQWESMLKLYPKAVYKGGVF